MNEVRVMVMVNFIGINFRILAFSHSGALLSAMDITITVNTDREIDINITIHAPALLSISQNSYYQSVTLISLFCPFHCKHVRLVYHDICSFLYSRSNTSIVLQSYEYLYLNACYKYTYPSIHFIEVCIEIFAMKRTGD